MQSNKRKLKQGIARSPITMTRFILTIYRGFENFVSHWKILVIAFIISCTSITVLASNDYLQYYKLTNQAELEIVDSSYAKALHYYEEAFTKVDYSFARDHYNAALCAYLIEDYEQSIKHIRSCII